jgi:hypothetical protein
MWIRSFEELETYLRNFETWDNRGGFDFGGAVQLLGACRKCLHDKAQEQELRGLAEHLGEQQTTFLRKLAGQ